MSRGNFLLLVAAGVALSTNPDEVSFREYLRKRQQMSGADWLTSTLTSRILSMVINRKDYKFFSVVKIPEQRVIFIGIFGIWVEIPRTITF